MVVTITIMTDMQHAHAYITNKSSLPTARQIQFLKQITGEICDSPAGALTETQIADTHQVMKGWTRLSKTAAAASSDINFAKAKKQNFGNSKTKNTHLDVAVKASKEHAVAVENLVKRLVDETKAGNLKANPTTEDYNCMLESWARAGEGEFGAERCEQILTQMQESYEAGDARVQPNLDSFKCVIQAWKHAGGSTLSSFRAQRILEWMVSLYQQGKNDLAMPDQMCFDTVLQSWSRNSHKMAPSYAEKLLVTMEKLGHATGSQKLRPRTLSFNAVLGAWGRASNNHKDTHKPWERATDILGFMENAYYNEGNTLVEPDRVSYHITMGTLARSNDPKAAPKADEVLRFVERQHKEGKLSWKPDTLLFNHAMACWAHSNKKGAYRKARSILDRQTYHFKNGCEQCRPDVYGYTSVLSTCAAEPSDKTEKAKAFKVAVSTFQHLKRNQEEYGSPNHVTYGTMLKCVAHLLPLGSPERQNWTKRLFQECASEGLVGGMVLSRMREAAGSAEEYKELMEGHTKGNLPRSWTKNVHEKNEFRRTSVAKRGEV
jgi:hypothetical protein